MARTRSFDPEQVLDAAMRLFWEKGYGATSLDDVTRATGVNKPSLYAAFGDKSALFLQVLSRYHERLLQHMKASLARSASPRESIRAWFLGFLPSCSGEEARGCLSVNATLEAASLDDAVWKEIEAFDRRQEALMRATLRRGQELGELSAELDPAAVARHLIAAQKGFLVLARGTPAPRTTRRAMEQALACLDRPPST